MDIFFEFFRFGTEGVVVQFLNLRVAALIFSTQGLISFMSRVDLFPKSSLKIH